MKYNDDGDDNENIGDWW